MAGQEKKLALRRLRRKEKIQRAVDESIRVWRQNEPCALPPYSAAAQQPSIYATLPRAKGLGKRNGVSALPPRRHDVAFKANFFRSIGRLFLWIIGAFRFLLGVAWDKIRGRSTEDTQARRLRMTIQRMGTTFIKFGQQMSMRLDILPYAYTRELAELLDSVPPFPTRQAIEIIENAAGKKLTELYSKFDPEPIGSASVACVYQAVLTTGERVAVKVRRPGIGPKLAADLRALEWLLTVAELTVLRPGLTRNFIFELRMMLMEELDFVQEARFTDLFRRSLRKTRQLRYASAPRVYFTHSNVEVLVTEFVSGYWLSDILNIVETNDAAALRQLEELDIDPVILARRFLLVSRFANFEHLFFHADLHPANILVQPGNKIILIDFGSCGSFTKRELIAWRRMFDAQSVDDVGAMVQAGMAVMEPLPPIDKDQLALRMEAMFWKDLYAIKSKHADWSERISARLWIGFLKIAREFGIPLRLNLLRMIRAIMLADTIAARLDHDLDPYREYRFYEKGAGKRASKRTKKMVHRLTGPGKGIRIEQGLESTLNLIYQVQRVLNSVASIRILPLIGKAALAAFLLLRAIGIIGLGGAVVSLLLLFWKYPDDPIVEIFAKRVVVSGYFQLFGLMVFLDTVRRITYRIKDPDLQ